MKEFERIAIMLLKKEVMEYLIAQWSFLQFSVFRGFFDILVGELAKFVIRKTSVGVYFLKVNLEVAHQSKTFLKASEELDVALLKGDEKNIEKAEEDLIKSAREFIKLR